MDRQLSPFAERAPATPLGGMPPPAPQLMPVQDLERAPAAARAPAGLRAWVARILVAGGTLAIASYGVFEMLGIVGFSRMTFLQGVMIFFFTVTFTWIAFAAASAVTGILVPPRRCPRADSLGESRTVLLMPVYNEDPVHTTAALHSMAEALAAHGVARHFEIVIISDSTKVDAWIAECIAVERLRSALAGTMPVWYRRRWHNVGRKSGNVEDFIKHWGARYDYMVVLDADSLMAAETLVELVKRMEADPRLGLLQTVPRIIGQWSLFSRLQQFAGSVYGAAIARGVAGWSADDGNFWGHNAVIRVAAFAQSCGLPVLPGPPPFGGHVLSHDFVEAALMRRAGWKVCMAPDLTGSWEDSPPSLTDVAVRDRRWAQGNLQHGKVIGARGLTWPSRLHFLMGIMSYVSSPLWLLLILTGFALTLQATLIRPEYFTSAFQLFPNWPRFDAERMVELFVFSMVVLLTPKAIGLMRALVSGRLRRGSGGLLGLPVSCLVETLLSALYAPIMMLVQTQHICEIFTGRDSGWKAQRRAATGVPWSEAWHFHWKHTLFGVAMACVAWWLSPVLLAWLSPALLGLLLAVPLSKASGSVRLGRALARLGIFRTPEETWVPDVVRRRDELARHAPPLPADGLYHLARDPEARAAHIAGNLPPPPEPRGCPDAPRLTAERKIVDARTLPEALEWLTPAERIRVAADARLLELLAALPDAA